MLRAGLIAAVLAGALVAGGALALGGGDGDEPPERRSCAMTESTFTTDTLHDLRSFSDAMAIVEAVDEELPPPPE